MRRVLIVFPTSWDRKQLAACRDGWEQDVEILWGTPSDDECPWDFDVLTYIDDVVEKWGGRIDGVFSSSDYPGATVAAAVAARLGLPGARPEAVIGSSHKFVSRQLQQRGAPDATPWFERLDPLGPVRDLKSLEYPCFVKPVKGAFSVLSRRVHSADELETFLASPHVQEFAVHYMDMFDRLVKALTPFDCGGRSFIAEGLLHGRQATVEGWVDSRGVQILGLVDSIMHPHAHCFARFDYPSRLPAQVQTRMCDVTRRVIAELGLTRSMFNVEVIYDEPADRISIIEVNPRICGQFGDLYQHVLGVNGYEIALRLARGEDGPETTPRGIWSCAASVPLRVLEPSRVVNAPTQDDVERTEREQAPCLVWNECRSGDVLAEFHDEDGSSQRYGVINLAAGDPQEITNRTDAVVRSLGYKIEPLTGADVPR